MMTTTAAQNKKENTDRLCYLFLIFLTGCLVGWVYEEIFYWFTEGLLRNRGILYGPWLPVYGIGALGIYALKPVKKHPVPLFFLCALAAGIVEYIIGFAGLRLFGLRLWDYRELFLNLGGIIWVPALCHGAINAFAGVPTVFLNPAYGDWLLLGPLMVGLVGGLPMILLATRICIRDRETGTAAEEN